MLKNKIFLILFIGSNGFLINAMQDEQNAQVFARSKEEILERQIVRIKQELEGLKKNKNEYYQTISDDSSPANVRFYNRLIRPILKEIARLENEIIDLEQEINESASTSES